MDPFIVIIWTCVAVFLATSAIALLSIIKVIKIEPAHSDWLFRSLVIEIVIVGVGAFGTYFYQLDRGVGFVRLPFAAVPIIQNWPPVAVKHGATTLYFASDTISKDISTAIIKVSTRPDFADSIYVSLYRGLPKDDEINGIKIQLHFTVMGAIYGESSIADKSDKQLILLDVKELPK